MKIGIKSFSYSSKRCINNITKNDYIRISCFNRAAFSRHLFLYIRNLCGLDLYKYILAEGYNGLFFDHLFYDVAHFFNGFSLSKTPWISTFETKLPYFHYRSSKTITVRTLKAMASVSCKAIISLSQCSANIQLNLLSNYPEYRDNIKTKLHQIYPPQELFINHFEEKNLSLEGRIKFIFVGRDFYRKGGYDILQCFRFLSDSFDFELIIVSSLINKHPQIFTDRIERETEEIIKRHNGSWLTYYPEVSNDIVTQITKRCHVGLLPTYSDTFGYSVLEFQACGCPVITTDVRALPGINNNDCGWMIVTGEKNEIYEITYQNKVKIVKAKLIENALKKIITDILENPSTIKTKSEKSIERIKSFHSPVEYQDKLEKLYCLAKNEGRKFLSPLC